LKGGPKSKVIYKSSCTVILQHEVVQKLGVPACLICNVSYVCTVTPCFVPEVQMKFYCVTFSR